jgi:hypothetical protein
MLQQTLSRFKGKPKKGHTTIIIMSLQTGYDFYKFPSGARALSEAEAKKPYEQLITFPHE